ncbi:MAG: hypothetical protein ABUT39_23400 [Acidobacteriota bacterium]
MRLPGREPFPRVDDHLVQPEVTRDEMIGGRRVVASPAHPPHATQHSRLDYVIQAHTAPGYIAASDLLTRHDRSSDFATDACIYKEGIDPETGARHLEEIAFEVVSEQNESLVTEKASRMHQRGVRRIFTVWVKGRQRVCEWSPESGSWHPLDSDASIEDPLLVAPLSASSLLDAAAADDAVAEALLAKGNPVLQAREAAIRAEASAAAIFQVLDARGIAVSPAQRQTILACSDQERLDRWVRRAAVGSSADDVIASTPD